MALFRSPLCCLQLGLVLLAPFLALGALYLHALSETAHRRITLYSTASDSIHPPHALHVAEVGNLQKSKIRESKIPPSPLQARANSISGMHLPLKVDIIGDSSRGNAESGMPRTVDWSSVRQPDAAARSGLQHILFNIGSSIRMWQRRKEIVRWVTHCFPPFRIQLICLLYPPGCDAVADGQRPVISSKIPPVYLGVSVSMSMYRY